MKVPQKGGAHAPPFAVGEFQQVYDPSVGEQERWYINDHTIFRDRIGTWHLIGITHPEPAAPFDELHFAHATAPALMGPWTKHPYALSTDPSLGEAHLWAPHVIDHEGRYWMFYCAGGSAKSQYRIHLATSEDGFAWERHRANPLVVDGYEARDPMVLRIGDEWVMYYTATEEPTGGRFVVAAVTSADLLTWGPRRIVYRDEMSGTGAGPTESPFVVNRGGRYHLFIGPDWETIVATMQPDRSYDRRAYRRTRVLVSDDPFAFDLDGQIAVVDAHAAEIVADGDTWWMSHCGWRQGGVYLAPIDWGDDTAHAATA